MVGRIVILGSKEESKAGVGGVRGSMGVYGGGGWFSMMRENRVSPCRPTILLEMDWK